MMAKYCGYCGNPITDNAKACGNCGASLKNLPSCRSDKIRRNNTIGLVTVICLILIGVVIVANVVSGFVGAKGIARKVMNSYINYDVDTLLYVASDYYYIQTDLSGVSIGTYFENQIDSVMARYDQYFGESFKLTYKITDSYEIDDYHAVEIYDSLISLDAYDINNVTDIMAVEVEVKIEGEELSFTEPWKMVIIKESNHWRLFSLGLDNSVN